VQKRIVAFLLALMTAFTLVSGCSPKSEAVPEPSSEVDDTLVIFDHIEWIGSDMYQCDSWSYAQSIMADSLFVLDPVTGEMLPNVISEYKYSDDGLTLTMTLPEGLRYANGEPVEPEDVVASILHGREHSSFAYGYSSIVDMKIEGRDIICTLSEYRSDLEYFLAQSFVGVIDKDQLDSMTPEELLWGALPYGPYYIKEFSPGSHVLLEANPYYKTHNPLVKNKDVPHLKKVLVKFAGEDFTIQQAIRNGEIDLIMRLSMENYQELQGAPGVRIQIASGPNISYMELNADNEHLKDIRVRQAIMYAIDREDIAEMTRGSVVPSYALVYKTVQNYSQEAWDYFKDNYCNNIEKAKQLLAEAGYTMGSDGYLQKDGKRLELLFKVRTASDSQTCGQAMQIQLKEIGIKLNLEALDWSYVNEAVVSGNFELGFLNLGWGEPILLLNRFTRGPASNPNPDVYYDLVHKCSAEPDYDKRTEYVFQCQKMLFDYGTVVPLFSPVSYCAFREEVEGLIITERADLYLNDAVKKAK